MSLLIVWTERDRALLAVDTKGLFLPAPGAAPAATRSVSKLFPFVAAGVVLACRGSADYLSMLLSFCNSRNYADFDEFASGLPEALAVVEHAVRSQYRALGIAGHGDLARVEVCIVGRSARASAMRAQMFVRTGSDSGFVPEAAFHEWIQPWIWADGDCDPPTPSSVAELARIAHAQVAWCERESPGQAVVGGSLIVAEMSSEGCMRISNVCSL
ncbi:MAG: hypothetical protein Q8R33_00355 [Burkholderiales bacterium]|nr:hypothetical protein [Burkholderiales bacterium]